MRFRVYYGDGSTFDSDNPRSVKERWNVAGVVQPDPVGRRHVRDKGRETVCCRYEYYLYSIQAGHWIGLRTESDMIDWVMNNFNDIACILKGRMYSRIHFEELWERMRNDPGFPEKSATDPYNELGER